MPSKAKRRAEATGNAGIAVCEIGDITTAGVRTRPLGRMVVGRRLRVWLLSGAKRMPRRRQFSLMS